ncbi:hypothetical protein LMG23992_04447 [Cupriavidus laharis]|uniref:Amidohydrolase-related domain-containing protein n=1 Tax=Cupriavidus laharis TaxID=151654 RepID=A0ABN7ZAS6_9BURK|nr:amidohydrolase family protein [Cupriavidus laharis]CAG9181214.1 hypothetical protein LMG23992_04447 [Cupriavidus laharis]
MQPLRIDAHQHFWRYRAGAYPWIGPDMAVLAADHLPEDLLPQLQARRMDACIAVQARASREETRFLLGLAARHPWIAAVVGWEDLGAAGLDARLEEWGGQPKLRGFRHQVQDEPDAGHFLAAPAFARGVALLQARGYAYDVLVFSHQLEAAGAFCARHDAHWLVLDHLGKPPVGSAPDAAAGMAHWRRALEPFRYLPHVACKLSGLVTEADWRTGLGAGDIGRMHGCLDAALDVFGPQRLMFGSDWPVCRLAASYADVHGIVRQWADQRLGPEGQRELWGGTAARCYGLPAGA